jgi:putative phage-type endonuclease
MNQQEWLEWRRQGIGASDAPVVMGVSPWKKISQLLEEKVFGAQEKDNSDMERGRELEPVALELFMKEMNIDLSFQDRLVHKEHDWMRATLDGINYEKQIVVEVKCPKKQHTKVPDHYYPQLQHQLEVTGFDTNYFVSYDGIDLRIFEVNRDQKYINTLLKEEKAFWDAVINLDFSKYAEHEDKEKDVNWKETAELYIKSQASLKEVEEIAKFYKSQLILFADGKNAKGHGVRLTKSMVKGSVDYALIPELKDVDMNKYRKPAFPKFTVTIN